MNSTGQRNRLSSVGTHVLDFLFSPRCVGCGKEGGYFCPTCLGEAKPLPRPYYPDNGGGPNACLVSSIYLSGVISCYAMDGAVREAVHELKYNGVRSLVPTVAEAMSRRLRESGLPVDAITPVPLHPKRSRERGFNQSELLARRISQSLGIPFLPVLRRTLHGQPQARSRDMRERRASVLGAFTATTRLEGQRILLIDDVCTTGATLDACAQPLILAGALSVWGLTFAREI